LFVVPPHLKLMLNFPQTKKKKWGWFAGPEKPGVFEIAWQQEGSINRIALALERHQVGVIDVSQVTALRDDS
jgi:transducin (beta)-like 1